MNNIRTSRSASFIDFRRAYQVLLQSYQRQNNPINRSPPRNIKSDHWLELVPLSIENTSCSTVTETQDKLQSSEIQLTKTTVLQRNENDVSRDDNNSSDVINNTVIVGEPLIEPMLEDNTSMTDLKSSSQQNLPEDCSKEDQSELVASVSSNTRYDCKQCKKKFQLKESFRAHMHVHSDTKRFTCHICGKQFGQTGSLYYHLKHVHGGVKQHACDICGRSFAMKAAMEDHRRIHTGERPYCCASCGKTFKTKASLYIHNKTHTDELPHKCSYCPKAFRWRQQMLGHLTIHTGQKNHICEICGKRFGVKNDLTRHKRIHSEEKPFTCQQCGLCFGQKRYLKNHERTRHR